LGKLLITIHDPVDELVVLAGAVPLRREDAHLAVDAIWDTAVICDASSSARGYFALTTVTSVARVGRAGELELRLEVTSLLTRPIPIESGDERGTPAGIAISHLEEAAYAELLASIEARAPGLEEDQTAFIYVAADAAQALPQVVNEYYRETCAFTGTPLLPSVGVLPSPAAVRPIGAGGEQSPSNFIAATPAARLALERGHLTIGPNYEFITALDKIDPELLEALNPIGRLRLPSSPEAVPDPRALDWHRRMIFNRP
jgi:hypothetical protein